MISDKLKTRVMIAVTCVWVTNFAAGLMPFLDYEPDQMINGIFMGVVGTIMVASARQESKSDSPKNVIPGSEVAE